MLWKLKAHTKREKKKRKSNPPEMSQSSEEVEAETGKERQGVERRIVRSKDKDSALKFYTDQSTVFRYLQRRGKK